MKKKVLCLLMAVLMVLLAGSVALADGEWIVTVGNDLTKDQRAEVFNMLGVKENEVQIVTITIDEEKALLGDMVPSEKIGTRSLSCASVRPAAEGAGIKVTTQNITWVSDEMYASAMATAGIADAEVKVACPVKVSGTAALAGIFKAYEASSGELNEKAKETATEELVTTGELGDIIGQDQAAELISLIKQKILEMGYDKPENVRPVVIQIANENNITLTEEQITTITNLVVSIANLDIDSKQLASQVQKINDGLKGLAQTSEKAMSFVESIKTFFANLVNWFKGLFGNMMVVPTYR